MTGLHKGQNASKTIASRHHTSKKNCFKTSTPICPLCTPVKSSNECYHFKHAPIFKMQSHTNAGVFLKRKREDSPWLPFVIFPMLWSWFSTLCHAYSYKICSKDKNIESHNSFPTFWGKKIKFTIHCYYSSITIHCHYSLLLFTCYCSLRNFAYLRGAVPYI